MTETGIYKSPVVVAEEIKSERRLHTLEQQLEGKLSQDLEATAVVDQVVSDFGDIKSGSWEEKRKILEQLGGIDDTVAKLLVGWKKVGYLVENSADAVIATGDLSRDQFEISQLEREHGEVFLEEQRQILRELHSSSKLTKERALDLLQELKQALQDPELIWRKTIETSRLGKKVWREIDTFIFWLQLRDLLSFFDRSEEYQNLDGKQQKLVRAKLLLPLLDSHQVEMSPTVLEDLIEGRSSIEDPWFSQHVVQSFLDVERSVMRRKKLSTKEKIVLVTLVGSLLGGLINATYQEVSEALERVNSSESIRDYEKSNQRDEEESEAETSESEDESAGGVAVGGSGSGSGEGSGTGSGENGGGSGPPTRETYIPAENSGEIPPGFDWTIRGDVPDVYFRTHTAAIFYTIGVWSVQGSGISWQPQLNRDQTTLELEANFPQTEGISVPLPVPYGYDLTYIDLGNNAAYNLIKHEDGSYSLYIKSSGSSDTIKIGYAPVENSGDQQEIAWDVFTESDGLIGDGSNLPPEVLSYLNDIKDSNMSAEQKAEAIASFVRDNFIYSLNPEYSNYFKSSSKNGEFIRRAFEMPYVDCDVANTVVVGMLRYVGVPARMSYGYANSQTLLNIDGQRLEKGESHGWTEYYDAKSQEWKVVDGTPTRVDEYSKSRLEGHNGGEGITGVQTLDALLKALLKLKFSILNAKDFAKANAGWISTLALLFQGLVQAIVINVIMAKQRKKLEKGAEKLWKIVPEHTGDYLLVRKLQKQISQRHEVTTLIDLVAPNGFFPTLVAVPLILTSLPAWGAILLQRHHIKKMEAKLKKIEETDFSYDEGYYFSLMATMTGMSERDTAELMLNPNPGNQSNEYYMVSESFHSALQDREADKQGILINEFIINEARLEGLVSRTNNFDEFLDEVIDDLHESYLVEKQTNRKTKRMRTRSKGELREIFSRAVLSLAVYWQHTKNRQEYLSQFAVEEKWFKPRQLLDRAKKVVFNRRQQQN